MPIDSPRVRALLRVCLREQLEACTLQQYKRWFPEEVIRIRAMVPRTVDPLMGRFGYSDAVRWDYERRCDEAVEQHRRQFVAREREAFEHRVKLQVDHVQLWAEVDAELHHVGGSLTSLLDRIAV